MFDSEDYLEAVQYQQEQEQAYNQSREAYRNVIRKLIADGIAAIKDGRIKCSNIYDLQRCIEIDLQLQKDGFIFNREN